MLFYPTSPCFTCAEDELLSAIDLQLLQPGDAKTLRRTSSGTDLTGVVTTVVLVWMARVPSVPSRPSAQGNRLGTKTAIETIAASFTCTPNSLLGAVVLIAS